MMKTLAVLSVVLFAFVAGCHEYYVEVGGQCQSDADCADGDPCTVDICGVHHTCVQVPADNPACDADAGDTGDHADADADVDGSGCVPTDEVCNGRDDDCDGETDEGCAACVPTPEVCDGIDNDCDGNTDEGLRALYYLDRDGDGWGDPAWWVSYSCPGLGHPGWVTNRGDCNDSDPAVHAGAGCPPCQVTYYRDADSDGYGDPTSSWIFDCSDQSIVGYVPTIGDCDDADSAVHTDAVELCDGIDNDCDGVTDEGCL